MNKITKAVIPVAGLGTRMLPATKAIPKEMLPIVDKPIIQYVVHECIAAGIKDIVLVTHASKNAIENHFDTSFELESTLEKRVQRKLLNEIQSICPDDVTIMHVRQGIAKGLGHAILCALPLVGDSPFAVLLPDVLIGERSPDSNHENLAAMIASFEKTGISQIMVEPVLPELVSSFGIVDCDNSVPIGESCSICAIVEKPSVTDAPSNMAVVGRYILSSSIWDILSNTSPGVGDEIQLTDAISELMTTHPIEAFRISGKSYDCGTKIGYMKANVEFALSHEQIGAEFKAYLKELIF